MFSAQPTRAIPPINHISPINVERFHLELRGHPDRQKTAFVLDGLRNGFRLLFNEETRLKSALTNRKSALEHPEVIDGYLAKEVEQRRLAGPFIHPPVDNLHVSRFGVIPKKSSPNSWRLILDLSHPDGFSVNDGIDPARCHTEYCKFDDAVRFVADCGKGALMAKLDIKSAYRIIPVHPEDRYLLGMQWRNYYFMDLTLPFGLRSAPFIFNSVAGMLCWVLRNNYTIKRVLHYLDDYFTVGSPGSTECTENLRTIKGTCSELGIPLAPEKCIGPVTCIIFLGIEIDSVTGTARLPGNKLEELKRLVLLWLDKRSCTKRELESVIGKLQHASLVVRHGRTFLRRLFSALAGLGQRHHYFRLTRACKQDIEWWGALLRGWNGINFYELPEWEIVPDIQFASDASGTIGYGVCYKHLWFNGSWKPAQQSLSIAYKELFPIVLACAVWGQGWHQKRVRVECDNESVVAILRSGTSKDENIMQLMRQLFLIVSRYNFTLTAIHVPGKHNKVADALSRFRLQEFFSLVPTASPTPVNVPDDILKRLTSLIYINKP